MDGIRDEAFFFSILRWNPKMQTDNLAVRSAPGKGRGVFSIWKIEPGETICRCHVIEVPPVQDAAVRDTVLGTYVFDWPGPRQKEDSQKWSTCCIALGVASLINHSSSPNSKWFCFLESKEICFIATKTIHPGEEVVHDYHWEGDLSKLIS